MAFIDQVQDLVSLTATDTGELSQFLSDGVIDVTNRWLAIKPQEAELFAVLTAEQTSSANLNGAKIISVIREDGTNNQWRECRKISASEQYNVTDKESLNYASKINPAYMVDENGLISVFPTPEVTTDAYKVYYVNNTPQDDGGAAIAHDDTTIKYFPNDKIYLVIMYAGMRLLQAHMGLKEMPFQPVFLEITPSSASYDNSIQQVTNAFTSIDDTLDRTEIDTALDNDDVELAQARVQELQILSQSRIQEVQVVISNELNKLQSDVQVDNVQVAQFQADATANVQRYQAAVQSMGAEYQWLQDQHARLKAEYDAAFMIAAPKQQQVAQQPQGAR